MVGGQVRRRALVEKRTYSAMSQMTETAVMRGAALVGRLNFDFGRSGNNGNLKSQQITTPTRTFAQNYGYDPVNRLRIAWEGSGTEAATCAGIQGRQWCQRLGYDEFANAWGSEQVNLAGLAANGRAWYLLASGTVNNRIKDVGYDAAGNRTQYQVNSTQRVADYDGGEDLAGAGGVDHAGRVFLRWRGAAGETSCERGNDVHGLRYTGARGAGVSGGRIVDGDGGSEVLVYRSPGIDADAVEGGWDGGEPDGL